MSDNSSRGGDDLRAAADRLRSEARNIGDQLEEGPGTHFDQVSPELKQTMDDLSGAVSDLAGKAKGLLGSIAGKIDAAAGSADDAANSARGALGGPDADTGDAAAWLSRSADTGVSMAKDAASKGSDWLEKTTGMSADELLDRAKTYGDDVTASVKGVVEGVQRSGEQAVRDKGETLN